MAVIPLFLNLAEDFVDSLQRQDDDFGFGIYPQEIVRLNYHRPSSRLSAISARRNRKCPYSLQKRNIKKGDVHVGEDGFQASVDVQHFKPNEITVKTVDNTVVIECQHEEREDYVGVISRQFTRKFTIPKGYDPKDIVSTLSSDGVLTVKAPLPPSKRKNPKERIVHIQQTGPACDSIRNNTSGSLEESTTEEAENKAENKKGK